MDLETAQTIIDAFGPCTTLYECYTAEEIVTDFADEDVEEFVGTQLVVLEVEQDRSCAAAGHEAETYGEQHHAKAVAEAKQQTKDIKRRLKEAGLL